MKRKIAIPLENGVLCQHFGHCTKFSIIETEDNKITGHLKVTPPPHEPGLLPSWLAKMGVTNVIAGGMGKHAIDLFGQNRIEVCTGAQPKDPEELAMELIKGELRQGSNSCDH